MTANELVDGAGWISDESSFYGDDETVARWEKRARRELELFSQPVLSPVAKKRKLEGSRERLQGNKPEERHEDDDVKTTASPTNGDHVLDFLKSRPQLAKLQKDFTQNRKPMTSTRARTVAGEEASDLVNSDHFKGCPEAWQQNESINDFLKRLPVAEPNTASVGPWLWVSSPQVSRTRQEHEAKSNPAVFTELGETFKEAFIKQRSKIEAENQGKAPATITRKMGPYRDQLEEDLLAAAVTTHTTCGKWMLFPGSSDLPRYWRVVAKATSEGKLGPVSKVATPDPYDGKDETLICVYTYDFTDLEDVRRVLDELVDLDLCRQDGKPIYYKCDAYTYMNLSSNNDYKLRASLYSSAELFKDAAKPLKEGPIARLKKRNGTIDSFLAS